jgi:hypothetical protein
MAKEPKKLDALFHDTLKDIYFARGSKSCGPHPTHLPRICACDAEDAGAVH